jgi:hypothetical protein
MHEMIEGKRRLGFMTCSSFWSEATLTKIEAMIRTISATDMRRLRLTAR